jgi:type II secretory ATPase GspE/PulE/Tfp pilus assembly ATPase PilB-like protein
VYGAETWGSLKKPYNDDFKLYRPVGCAECGNTGYKGRMGIHELLLNSEQVKQLIQTRARVTDIVQTARQEGMTTLVQDGILKVLDGWTDIAQVQSVAI